MKERRVLARYKRGQNPQASDAIHRLTIGLPRSLNIRQQITDYRRLSLADGLSRAVLVPMRHKIKDN